MKKLDRLLIKILLASIVIFVLSLTFSPIKKNEPKAIESVLLNPKYQSDVKKIVISKTNEEDEIEQIELAAQGDFYLLSDSKRTVVCLADSKIVNSLIEKSQKVRKMYEISDKNIKNNGKMSEKSDSSDGKSSFLSNERLEISVSFLTADEKLISKIYFGDSDSLKNTIYLASENSSKIFETENEFSQFLTTDFAYWAEGRIFSEIENPVQIKFEEFGEDFVSKKTAGQFSENFSSKSNSLLSLRHGKIFSGDTLFTSKPDSMLTLFDGNGRILKIEFFEKSEIFENGEVGKSYFYKKNIIPSEVDSQENIFAFYSENAVYEISSWTYEKLKAIANDKKL